MRATAFHVVALASVVMTLVVGIRGDQDGWVDPHDPYSKRPSREDDRSHWVDPMDHHNYDHATKCNKGSSAEVNNLKAELSECKEKCSNTNKDNFLVALLQRQTAMILRAAGLSTETVDTEYQHVERYLILSLSVSELEQLQKFLNSDEFSPTQLSSIWDTMLIKAEDPQVPKWYHFSFWTPSFTISKQTFYISASVGVVVTIIAMIVMGHSLGRIIFLVLMLTFAFSASMRVFRQHQVNVARREHLRDPEKLSSMPSACRPHSLTEWEKFWSLTSSNEYKKEACDRYFEEGYVDPVTLIDPFELVWLKVGDSFIVMSSSFGTSFKKFFDTSFADMPDWLSWLLLPIIKAVVLIGVLVVAFMLSIWMAPGICRTASSFIWNAICGPPAEQRPIINGLQNATTYQTLPPTSQQPIINVNVMLPSDDMMRRPRSSSEPVSPQIAPPPPKRAKKRRSLPVLMQEPIEECPPTPPAEHSCDEEVESVVEATKSPDSGRSSPARLMDSPLSCLDTDEDNCLASASPKINLEEFQAPMPQSPFLAELEKLDKDDAANFEDAAEKK